MSVLLSHIVQATCMTSLIASMSWAAVTCMPSAYCPQLPSTLNCLSTSDRTSFDLLLCRAVVGCSGKVAGTPSKGVGQSEPRPLSTPPPSALSCHHCVYRETSKSRSKMGSYLTHRLSALLEGRMSRWVPLVNPKGFFRTSHKWHHHDSRESKGPVIQD